MPPPGWAPDPSWPPAPPGWNLVVDEAPQWTSPAAAGQSPTVLPAAPPAPSPYAPAFGAPVAAFAPGTAQPNPMAGPGWAPMPHQGGRAAGTCRICGGGPAVTATARKHTGMLILMRFGSLDGPFCRDCGLAVTRQFMAHTLVAGWWGYLSMIIAPITLIIDAVLLNKLHRLPPPGPPAPGGRRIDPGPPVFSRWQIAGLLVPVAVLALILVGAAG